MNEQVVKAATKLLTIRNYSRQEVAQKLLKQAYDEADIAEAVEYLTKRGYLNDAALCDRLLEKYFEDGKYSMQEIYLRLRRRGLSTDLINGKLANCDTDAEYQAAMKTAKKWINSKDNQDLHKIIRRLSAKGFKAVTVSKVLAHLRDMYP